MKKKFIVESFSDFPESGQDLDISSAEVDESGNIKPKM